MSEEKKRSLQKLFLSTFSVPNNKATKALLHKFTNSVCFSVRANILSSVERYEQLCIGLMGAADEQAREVGVKMLNIIYDGHVWQKTEAFEPVIRCVGDCFAVEMEISSLGEVNADAVCLQVCMAAHHGDGQRVLFTVTPRVADDKMVVDGLPSFSRCGFVDWRFVYLDQSGLLCPIATGHVSSGRVIVLPKVRADVILEVMVDSNKTFAHYTAKLRDYQRAMGVTTVYVSGACSGASVDELSDRRIPKSSAGGAQGFNALVEEAEKLNMNIIVDADHRVSASSYARRYDSMLCYHVDPTRRFRVPMEGHDGLNMVFQKCATLNYRKKQVWDELLEDMLVWCGRGASGIRLAAAHCAPLILQTDVGEMAKLDPDGHQHYTVEEIFEGLVCLRPTNEAVTFGYYGTESSATYPNPLLVKLAMGTWRKHPEARLLAESYWGRERNALASGFVPQSSELSAALNALNGVSVTPDWRKTQLPAKASVKALYDWFREERSRFPTNSILINASSHHFLPYPLLLQGRGAWATVDLLFFGPDVPSLFDAEALGDCRWWGNPGLMVHDSLGKEIAGHYSHRSRLRSTYRVLRDGGFLPLLTFWGEKSWHDRVFAFARFTADKVAICAINFNDAESVMYVDLSPLEELCDQASSSSSTQKGAMSGMVFKVLDLIDPSAPAKYFVPSEFLKDHHYIALPPYCSLLWGLFVEAMSPGTERTLYEQSFQRLQNKLAKGEDSSCNMIFRELTSSFASVEKFGTVLERLIRLLSPDRRLLFPEQIRQMLYFLSREDRATEGTILSFIKELAGADTEVDSTVKEMAKRIAEANAIGPIVFITPEMGRFSTVGGIGVMVSELTRSLAELGLDVRVISPYYNYDKKGNTGYLEEEGIKWQQNIVTSAGNEFVECGLHVGEEMGVKLYFIHHWKYFSTPYQSGSPSDQLQALVVLAKASLELLCQIHVIPSIVVTNDWFTGLVPAYARHTGSFGSSFAGTTFFHLVHNLEQGYEGKIYVDGNDDLGHLHQMRRELIVESFDGRVTVLNSSKCALLSCNQWGTVSRSYRDDLLKVSPLQYLLNRFPAPFAHLNGIRTKERMEKLEKAGATDHHVAKKMVQEKYFGYSDPNKCLFAFVGRVVLQKGVHLILECARVLLSRPNSQIQIMVCGPANKKDPYASSCAWKMAALCKEYKGSFWADPDLFFTDGSMVNTGADFALMPSLFEPSGIVQQEFFSGGTPVIAFKTGGLKDTVFEYNISTGKGNGLTFESHQFDDLMAAIDRSRKLFNDPENYAKLRENARKSVLDNTVVADAWAREFCRLKQRLWNDPENKEKEKEKAKDK